MSAEEQTLMRELLLEINGDVKELRSDVTEVKHGMGDLKATTATDAKCLERAVEVRQALYDGMKRTHEKLDDIKARVDRLEAKKQRALRIRRWFGSKAAKILMAAAIAGAGALGSWLVGRFL